MFGEVRFSCAGHDMLLAERRYVEQFDQAAMAEMTRVVSAEGAQLVEAQTYALFGDLKALQRQMQARTPGLPLVLCPLERRTMGT